MRNTTKSSVESRPTQPKARRLDYRLRGPDVSSWCTVTRHERTDNFILQREQKQNVHGTDRLLLFQRCPVRTSFSVMLSRSLPSTSPVFRLSTANSSRSKIAAASREEVAAVARSSCSATARCSADRRRARSVAAERPLKASARDTRRTCRPPAPQCGT